MRSSVNAAAAAAAQHQNLSRELPITPLIRSFFAEPEFMLRQQVASSTPMQMLLFFNMFGSILWLLAWVFLFQWKVYIWEPPLPVAILTPTIFVAWAIIEPIRLALGYVGNLTERVALLGPFFIATLAQIAIQIILLLIVSLLDWIVLRVEAALAGLAIGMYVLELFCAYFAGKRFIAKAEANYELFGGSGQAQQSQIRDRGLR